MAWLECQKHDLNPNSLEKTKLPKFKIGLQHTAAPYRELFLGRVPGLNP